jgi:uncharacterized protein
MNQLKPFILSRTDRENRFVFDRSKNSNLLCNHGLFHILKLVEEGTNVRQWLDGLDSDYTELDGCGRISKKELEYYYRKYEFLKNHGYFAQKAEGYPVNPFNPEMIEQSLANCRQITFEVTERCNINCRYCGYGHIYSDFDSRTGKDLDIETAKNLLLFLFKYWNSSYNVSHGTPIYFSFYGGEPLLNIRFIEEIINFVQSRELLHNKTQFSMTTNALLLEKHMDFLVENNFNLLISLDGNRTHNSYRVYKNGKPAYQNIIDNVEAFRRKYPDYFREKVHFNAVLHDKNNVPEILDFFKKKYDKLPRVGQLRNIGIKEASQNDFWKMYKTINQDSNRQEQESRNLKKDMFLKHPDIQNLSIFLLKYSGFVYENYRHLLSTKGTKRISPTGTCAPFSKRIFVTAGGKLLPCETIAHQFSLGKATRDGVDINFSQISQTYNNLFREISRQCKRCYDQEACPFCVFNLRYLDGKPVCDMMKDYETFSREISLFISEFESEPELYTKIMEDVTIE